MRPETTQADTEAQWREERKALRQRVAELEAQLHQANVKLDRQRQFTEALLTAIPIPVFFKDAQGRYLGCNDAFTAQVGLGVQEIKGKTVDDLWPSAHAEVYAQQDRELMQHPPHQVYESVVRDKTGLDRQIILTERVFYDETGQVAGLVGAYMDITERKQAEGALRESQALFQSLVESMPQNVFSKDLEGRFTFANRQYCKTVGRSLEDILGKTDFDIHPAALARKYRQDDGQVMQQRHVFQTTEEHQALGGTKRYVQVVKAPLFDAAGQVRGMLGIFWDVTANMLMQEALRASEERYRRLFERSKDAIFVVDRQTGRYREANAAAEKLTGRSRAELQGLTTLDVTPNGAEERLAQVLTAQQTLDMGQVRYLQPDGVTRTASLDVVPLDEQTVFGIARDITERREMEERLQRQERLAAVGQLAAGIAHDFRNLLTTIILYTQLGQRHPDLPSAVAQRLEVVVGEARKATDLVRQILDFSRCTEIDRHPLDLAALVGDVVTVLRRTLPENIHITFAGASSGVCIVEGDAGRLQQALTNLALNARDVMPDGGDLHIGVTRVAVEPGATPPLPEMGKAVTPPAWIRLSVTDTGVGMNKEVRAHLFEPFFTTKAPGRGTGLGLAQVYGIVQLHAGYIDVETAVGQGSTFCIYLPAVAWAAEKALEDTTTVPRGQGERLLFVEDNAHLREAGQGLLTELGYRVLTAANGREALALAQAEGPFALLITDLVMPEMGGKALLQALRRRVPDLKALAVTGYTAEESVQTLQAAGFLDVIRKPFDADRLARAVRRALDEGGTQT